MTTQHPSPQETNMSTEQPAELPYGGTVRDLRIRAAHAAARAEKIFEDTLLAASPWSNEQKQLNLMAHCASLYGYATAGLLRFIAEKLGEDAAFEAAATVQDMGENGGAEWCDDLTDEEIGWKHA